jgi:hypothetical protein
VEAHFRFFSFCAQLNYSTLREDHSFVDRRQSEYKQHHPVDVRYFILPTNNNRPVSVFSVEAAV